MTTSRTDVIVCYGDSQTAGFSWGTRLVELSGGRIRQAINRGASGQSSGTVGVRQGGVVLNLLQDVEITGTNPIDVTFESNIVPCNQRTPSIPGALSGVRGTLKITTPASATGQPSGTFTPTAAPTAPTTAHQGDRFIPEDVLDHPEYAECLHIIWAGGNDRAFNGAGAAPGTVKAAQAQVDRLTRSVDNPLYLVAGPTVYANEVEGTTGHTRAVEARDQLAEAFPDNVIDIWGHVRDHGLELCGIEPTEADREALAGKSMPPSLTSDNIHFATHTRELVVAPFILSELDKRGWLTDSPGGTPLPDYTPTEWEGLPSKKTPMTAAGLNNLEAGVQAANTAVDDLAREVEERPHQDAVNTALGGKVDSTNTASRIYGTNSGGNPNLLTYSSAPNANTIPYRGTGGTTAVGTPTAANHAATKEYIDTAIANAVSAAVDPLIARIEALEATPEV